MGQRCQRCGAPIPSRVNSTRLLAVGALVIVFALIALIVGCR